MGDNNKLDIKKLPADIIKQGKAAKEISLIDKAIVERVLLGEKKAFDLLVLKYQQKIAHAVFPYIKDRSEVYDIVQESFIKAYRNLANYRGDSAFYSWLYRIAINTAKNYLSAVKIRPPRQDIDSREAHQYDTTNTFNESDIPENVLTHHQLSEQVQRFILELPDELQQVIVLRERHNLNYEQISLLVKCPVGTVRSRIFRAREILSDKIKPLL